ncbi:unnamed protein product, partial [marine sediment metagenome]
GALVVSVPSFRQDLKLEIDLIEEVVRVYGYDRLPSTMPSIVGHPTRIGLERRLSGLARDTLISLGMDEVITYSLVSRDDLTWLGAKDEGGVISIRNPLSTEQETMRRSFIPGMLRTAAWNLNRREKAIRIFEVGKVYYKEGGRFMEEDTLSMALAGDRSYGWHRREKVTFFDIKGTVKTLLERIGIAEPSFRPGDLPGFLTGEAASIKIDKERIGFFGKVRPEVLEKFDIESDLFVCELSLKKLLPYFRAEKRFHQIPRFPSVQRDISIVARKDISYEEAVAVMREAGGELIVDIELFDQYFGPQVPPGHRSLSYSIEYRAKDRTLTDEEVNRLHSKVCDGLIQKLQVKIR